MASDSFYLDLDGLISSMQQIAAENKAAGTIPPALTIINGRPGEYRLLATYDVMSKKGLS